MHSNLELIKNGIRRHGRWPVVFVVVVALATAGVTLLLPERYRAQASLLPPQESAESFGLIAGLIEASALSRVGLITASSTSDVFVEILGSRRVREAVLRRFDLMNRYKEQNLDECLKRFDENVSVTASRSKIVRLEVEDRDPEMAARICNALVEELDKVSREVRTSRASQQRTYLTEQLGMVEARLRAAENALSRYERSQGVVLGGGEAAAVEGVADLLARKLALQVRRSWMESYATRDNPGLTAVTSELQAVDRELSRLPGLKQQGDRMALDVEIQRRVFTLLTAQLEETKLEENRTMTALAVLDPARAPTKRAKPRRGFIVLVSTSVALVLAGAWVAYRTREDLARARGDLVS